MSQYNVRYKLKKARGTGYQRREGSLVIIGAWDLPLTHLEIREHIMKKYPSWTLDGYEPTSKNGITITKNKPHHVIA